MARGAELLRAHGFVAIVGASGSGKSSVALAGLAPNIGDAFVVRPGARPLDALDAADIDAHADAVLIVDQLEELFTLGCTTRKIGRRSSRASMRTRAAAW